MPKLRMLPLSDAPAKASQRSPGFGESALKACVKSMPPSTAPAKPDGPTLKDIVSPMVGTFYRAASPESSSFADVGKTVNEDTVVCIIEAMKVMNEIKAETSGVIAEVLVENGKPVQFGQALFRVRPS